MWGSGLLTYLLLPTQLARRQVAGDMIEESGFRRRAWLKLGLE
jgi:hypothetical protein